MHNYARYPYNGSVIDAGTAMTANYQDVWTKIASHYMNETTIWGYSNIGKLENKQMLPLLRYYKLSSFEVSSLLIEI